MRLLLLNQVFHPDLQATSQYLSRLAEEMARRGHEVTVLTCRRDYDDPEREYPARETWRGVEIIRVWNTGYGRSSKAGKLVDFASFLVMASLRGIFLTRADVVLALTTPPLISVLGAALSLLWQARFVYWVMDLNPDEAIAVGWLKPDAPLAYALEVASRWSLRCAAKVIVLDRYMRDRLRDKDIPECKIETIPPWAQTGIAFDPAGRGRFREAHGLADKFVVMYAGNHTPCHPLETLIEAAKLLQDEARIQFCFVGGGMEWGRLRAKARYEGRRNMTFLGYQPFTELPGLLSAADVQVVVMGNSFVGIIHPCKVYNFLATERPFIAIGPERSHISDLIRDVALEAVTASFRHGESTALAEEIRRQANLPADSGEKFIWPFSEMEARWGEKALLSKLVSTLEAAADS